MQACKICGKEKQLQKATATGILLGLHDALTYNCDCILYMQAEINDLDFSNITPTREQMNKLTEIKISKQNMAKKYGYGEEGFSGMFQTLASKNAKETDKSGQYIYTMERQERIIEACRINIIAKRLLQEIIEKEGG